MTPEKATALRRPFPPESIGKLPKGGAMLDYVGHAAVTDRLLTVDPDWSWEPFAIGPDGLPALDKSHNLWIRLTICGVTRIGVGDGKSAKECIGDAIRNAAMRFGVALDLWAKEDLVEFAQAVSVPPTPDPWAGQPPAEAPAKPPAPMTESGDQPLTARTRGAMFALFGELNIERAGQLQYIADVLGREVGSRADLTEDDGLRVEKALRADKAGEK